MATSALDVTTVLIVDDHDAFADLLAMALDAEDDFTVVGTASTGAKAVERARRERPKMILMDIELGDEDGLDVAREIRTLLPKATIVVVSAHTDAPWVAKAASVGASAFAPKSGSLTDMLAILRRAREGAVLTAPAVVRDLADPRIRQSAPVNPLTPREQEVLSLMGRGASPSQISRTLGISVNTCRGYVKAIHGKLDARSQLEAVVIALRLGLIDPAP